MEVVAWHPKHSPDLNAIENAWSYLRARLNDTLPTTGTIETRDHFIRRLRAAAAWINSHHRSGLLSLCYNQKERAQDVKENLGHRTEW